MRRSIIISETEKITSSLDRKSLMPDRRLRTCLRIALLAAALLMAGCAGTPKKASVAGAGNIRLVDYALSLQGTPYRYGKASPKEGFDCSGFVQHVYEKHGIPLPRTTREMAWSLLPVDKRERRPGDLLFFNTSGKPYSHVGIYVGHDAFVHAPSSRTGRVIVSSLDNPFWWRRFIGVRRPAPGDRLLSRK
jgi:cell wall-associated NlpC family hydrolase